MIYCINRSECYCTVWGGGAGRPSAGGAMNAGK